MKKIALFILVCFLLAGVAIQANGVPLTAALYLPKASSLNDIKKIKFPYKPIVVSTAESNSASNSGAASTASPSDKYSSGTGVTLSSVNLLDKDTGSSLSIDHGQINSLHMEEMLNTTNPFASIQLVPPTGYITQIFNVSFCGLKPGLHSYILTIKIESNSTVPVKDHLSLLLGSNTQFVGDSLVVNDSTKETHILFNYSSVDNKLNIIGNWRNIHNYLARIKLYYIQLTQVD